ncbi:GNAT family N-acetyltransferase [Silvimonas iriomotensis]|uniref:Acetyltransferase n=1 Tax=Silvimonas iriomotensis TaxID=449662 RepID=A0ABQ2P8Y5_9NEIS|nr:GNAT family N-acetyltransferase [Silvimonas iriomotensis]GGP20999.1 acetyltransferase [Silvimonas iriomotensis]
MKLLRTGVDDLPALQACFFASVSVLTAKDYTPEQRRAWVSRGLDHAETWRSKLGSQFGWKAIENETVQGFILLVPQDNLIDWLYVSPAAANSGVATHLLWELERTARTLGMPHLETHASITAQPFFERRGYALVEKEEVDTGSCVLPRALMRKSLQA